MTDKQPEALRLADAFGIPHWTGLPIALHVEAAAELRRLHKENEALRAALANEFNPDWDRVEALQESLREHMAEIQRLRAALAQPEQEPCIHVNNPKGCYRVRCQLGNKCVNDDMSFRTAPPQREWQGLTKEEYEAMAEKCVTNCYFDTLKYARAIEVRLREKNS